MAPLTMMALGQGPPTSTPDPGPPTAIEQALIEHICSATFTDAHQECLSVQLNSLRADFGRDLTRLSSTERRAVDSVCNRIRTEQGREASLDCLGALRSPLRQTHRRFLLHRWAILPPIRHRRRARRLPCPACGLAPAS
jgi:hypothetical protein